MKLPNAAAASAMLQPTDINAICDEYFRLAYHGLRAKDKTFNATMKTHYDPTLGKVDVVPQDLGRVILNLISNAFYAVDERRNQSYAAVAQAVLSSGGKGYEPTVIVSTSRSPSSAKSGNGNVSISVKDNGNGMPESIREKIFQPFFSTKPTGQGTGLGLSLSYNIVKAHGGELILKTAVGEGTEIIIQLPVV